MGKAIFEQRSGVLGVAVASACGVVTAQQLIGLGELAKTITVHAIKMTTRQTIVFLINGDDLEIFQQMIDKLGLKMGVFGNVVRSVKGCAGSDSLCQRSLGNAFDLGVALQERFMNRPTPKDFKISTAGCVRACTDPYCADFGVIAQGPDSFDIYVGGRGGSKKPLHGSLILENVTAEGVAEVLEYVLAKYCELGQSGERLCKVIERCGRDIFKPDDVKHAGSQELDDFLAFMNQ